MFDPTKPVCTRDGRKATILSLNHRSSEDRHQHSYPIRAEVEHPNEPGTMVAWSYMADGRWKSNDPCNHNDLVNEMFWHDVLRRTNEQIKNDQNKTKLFPNSRRR